MESSIHDDFERAWKYLQHHGDSEKALQEVMSLRDVPDYMVNGYRRMELTIVPEDFSVEQLKKLPNFKDMGLLNKDGSFLLKGRYIFPVKSATGKILALIGWFPDVKKYITTPSKYFSKSTLFYGMEQWGKGRLKFSFLVEGIFDRISLNALGVPAMATMGVTVGPVKQRMYPLLGQFVAIPDRDKTGSSVISSDAWNLPRKGKYLRLKSSSGKESDSIKDIDDLCKMAEPRQVQQILVESLKSHKRIESLII